MKRLFNGSLTITNDQTDFYRLIVYTDFIDMSFLNLSIQMMKNMYVVSDQVASSTAVTVNTINPDVKQLVQQALDLKKRIETNAQIEKELLTRIENWNEFVVKAIETHEVYLQYLDNKHNEMVKLSKELTLREILLTEKAKQQSTLAPVTSTQPVTSVTQPQQHLAPSQQQPSSKKRKVQFPSAPSVNAPTELSKFHSADIDFFDQQKAAVRFPFFMSRVHREYFTLHICETQLQIQIEFIPVATFDKSAKTYVVCANRLFGKEGINTCPNKTLRDYTKHLDAYSDYVKVSVYHLTVEEQQEFKRQASLNKEVVHGNKYQGAALVLCLTGRGLYKLLNALQHLIDYRVWFELRDIATKRLCWSYTAPSYDAEVSVKTTQPIQATQPVQTTHQQQPQESPLLFDPLEDTDTSATTPEVDFFCNESLEFEV